MASASGAKRGRPKNPKGTTKKVEPGLPPDAYACLERLVGLGYGSTATDVARYLILREIDDLKRSGVLKADA